MARVFELPVCAVSSVLVSQCLAVQSSLAGDAYRAGTARSTTSFRPFENRHLGAHQPVSLALTIASVLPNAGLPVEGRKGRGGRVLTKYNQRLSAEGQACILADYEGGVAREVDLSIAGDVGGSGVHEGVAGGASGRRGWWLVGHYL